MAELVVVVAIIILLIALILPLLGRVRETSRDVVCQARLRDLAIACNVYFDKFGQYPAPFRRSGDLPSTALLAGLPVPAAGSGPPTALVPPGLLALPGVSPVVPHNLDLGVLNSLMTQLTNVDYEIGRVSADLLPPALQAPSVEDADGERGPIDTADGTRSVYYTGYVYTARLAEAPHYVLQPNGLVRGAGFPSLPTAPSTGPTLPPVPGLPVPGAPLNIGVLLKASRSVRYPNEGNGVLWADDVHTTPVAGAPWQFSHARRSAQPGSLPFTYLDPAGCRGQHRAYTDGHVEWIKGDDLNLNPGPVANPDANATFRLGTSYWWF